MSNVSHTIWETCKTYLFQQGKFLAILWVLIAACMLFYFKVLEDKSLRRCGGHSGRPPSSAFSAATASPGSASASTPSPIPARPSRRSRAIRSRYAGHSAALRHERRPAAGLRGIVLHDLHPGLPAKTSPARASSASPSANRSAPPRCASAAASSPRSPTSAPT